MTVYNGHNRPEKQRICADVEVPQTLRELWDYWREDLAAHDWDWTRAGFRALAVHRLGNYRMHLSQPLRAPVTLVYRFLFTHVRNVYGVELPYTVRVGRRVIFEHQGIVIHGYAAIGDDCVIRQGVTLGNRYREAPLDAPTLGARVNVGAGAVILGAVCIGDDANVGANSVVVHDVAPATTVVGVPARPPRDKVVGVLG